MFRMVKMPFRDQLFGDPEETLVETVPIGETIFINNQAFTIIGMFEHYESEQARKERLERMASDAGLSTRATCAEEYSSWQVANRIAIEELEAWYFGEWHCVREAYPRVSPSVPNKAPYRDPDAIAGGT